MSVALSVPPHSPAATLGRRPRIVVAEDDAAMRDLLVHALEDQGYTVIESPDGFEALGWYRWSAAERRFLVDADLVITDFRMPRVDGLELLTAIQQSDCPVPVILLSGFADARLVAAASDLGAAAVLPKPFSMGALLAIVASVLDEER